MTVNNWNTWPEVNGGMDVQQSKLDYAAPIAKSRRWISGLALTLLAWTVAAGTGIYKNNASAQTAPAVYTQEGENAPKVMKASFDGSEESVDTSWAVIKVDSDGSTTIQMASVEVPNDSLWIDYLELTWWNEKLAEILFDGEIEWMSNFDNKRAGIMWEALAKEIAIPGVTDINARKASLMEEYIPVTIRKFSELPKEKYPYLESIGREQEWKDFQEIAKKLAGEG